MNVAVISLCPLSRAGATERFTLDVIQAIRAAGCRVEAFAIRDFDVADTFVHTFDAHERELQFDEVMSLLRSFDAIWIHQYLASELIFNILDAVTNKHVLLTNLGNTECESRFRRQYTPARNHHFVHPSRVLALDAGAPESASAVVPAGVWADAFGFLSPVERRPLQFCTVDGVTAAGAPETAILALPKRCSLLVAGAPQSSPDYLRYIGSIIPGRSVHFTGEIPDNRRRAVIASSQLLIAAQAPLCWDGTPAKADPFSCAVLLEALGCDTLPLVSDSPIHVEVMRLLGLEEFIFPARDYAALHDLIERVLAAPAEHIAARKARARVAIRASFLWDDYWCRVQRARRIEPSSATKSAPSALHPMLRRVKASTRYSAGAHTLDWKVFHA